jgi:TPR repeat protein
MVKQQRMIVLTAFLMTTIALSYQLHTYYGQKGQSVATLLHSDTNNFSEVFSAATAGNVQAQYQLGIFYLTGTGQEKNRKKATIWLKTSAQAGVSAARVVLKMMRDPNFLS